MLLAKAGLPDIRFHDLRPTAVTLMLNNNIPPIVVAKIVGHASPSTTENLYGHMMTEGQQEAVWIIGAIAAPTAVELKSPQNAEQENQPGSG